MLLIERTLKELGGDPIESPSVESQLFEKSQGVKGPIENLSPYSQQAFHPQSLQRPALSNKADS